MIRQHTQTSYGEATTPEQALAVAVILQAISDLTSQDHRERFEAHEFFLQPKGSWAYWRRFYFQAVNLDDEWLHEHLAHRLDPPERPDRKWSYQEVLEILPRDRAFTCAEEAKKTTLHPSRFSTRVNNLIDSGDVVRLEPGLYCVTEFEPEYHRQIEDQRKKVERRKPIPKPRPRNFERILLDALSEEPLTERQLLFACDGDLSETNIRALMGSLIARGIVAKDGPRYRILQDAAA